MTADEYAALKADIAESGLLEPLLTFDGKIIDGRNRYQACVELNITPKVERWVGNEAALVPFVVSMNLKRRHLNAGQLAGVALAIEEYEAIAAKFRVGGRPKKDDKKPVPNLVPVSGKSVVKAAKATGASKTNVINAKRLKAEAPDLFNEMMAGNTKIGKAVREADKRKRQEEREARSAEPLKPLTGHFDLILADPPWRYDFSKDDADQIENHYPTEPLAEIANHLPEGIAENAALLLWATAPKLVEAMELMQLWGFTYRTHAIWDKEKIGMGYWFRGQHELLLIGVRGNFSPPAPEDRVPSVFREARGKHSKKPSCVYEWIEQAFPFAVKLEMYARTPREGWACWGNEIRGAA